MTGPGTTSTPPPRATGPSADPFPRPPRQRQKRPAPAPPTKQERRRKRLGDLAAVLVVIGGIAAMVGSATYVAGHVVANSVKNQAEAMVRPTDCSLVSAEQLGEVLGRKMTAVQFGPMSTMGLPAMDTRLLPEAQRACWGVSDGDTAGAAVRIASISGDHAAGLYATARTTAVEGGFLGPDRPGLGDAAFCTTPDASGASGVFARRDDRVTYVSLTEGADSCAVAARLAKDVLDH